MTPTSTSAWYQGFTKGKYAGWISAAWGPIFLQDYTKNSKGKWRAQELPQWNEGQTVSGNWGGSTLAVLQASKNKAAATEFARWILQEQQPVEMFSYQRFLFPTLNSMLNNPQWQTRSTPSTAASRSTRCTPRCRAPWTRAGSGIRSTSTSTPRATPSRASPSTRGREPRRPCSHGRTQLVNYAKQQGLTVAGQ